MTKSADPVFRVQFVSQDKVYELFAKQIYSSDLYGLLKSKSLCLVNAAVYWSTPPKKSSKTSSKGSSEVMCPCMP